MKTRYAGRWNPMRALTLAAALALATVPAGAALAAPASAAGGRATPLPTDGGLDASPLDEIEPQPIGYAAREAAQPQAAAFRGKGVEIYVGGSALAVVLVVVLVVVLL